MTEEKLVERVTALFADSDAAQRKMIRLYAETNDAIEASAIIDSGAEVLHMLQGGPRLNRYLVHESVTAQLRTLGCYKNLAYGINYLQEAVYIAVCDRQACSLGELCTKAGEPFGVNGPAVRSALERLNARLYKSNTPAYQMLCERNGKTPQDRLTVSELLEAVIARTHHDLRC